MEHSQPDTNLPSPESNPSSDRFDFEGFLQVFQNYLLVSSKQDKRKECSDTPTPTPSDQPSDSPLPKEGNILKDLLTNLCMSVSDTLQELLTSGGDIIDPKARKHEDIEDMLEALLLLVSSIRTSPYNLICCQKHRNQLLSLFEWPESLLHKLIQYLVTRTDSESRLDKLLMRLLEVILNPPKDLGSSKAWLFLAREIENKLVLEDAEVCKFLSRVFVLLSPQAKVRISVSLVDYLKQIMYDDDTQDLVSNEMLNLVYMMSFDSKVQKSLISDEFQQKLLDWLMNSIDENTGLCDESLTLRNNIISHILINLFQSCERSDMKQFLTSMLTRGMSRYPNNLMLQSSSEIFSALLTSAGFNSFVPICIHFGDELGSRERLNKVKDLQNEGFLKGLNELNRRQKQKLLDKIQQLQPAYKDLKLESFDFQLRSLDKNHEYTHLKLQTAVPKILTFQYFLNDKLVTLGVYIGSSTKSLTGSAFLIKTNERDFVFCCHENGDFSIFEGDFTIEITADYKKLGQLLYVNYEQKRNWKIQIYSSKFTTTPVYLVDYTCSEGLTVNHLTITNCSKVYGSYIYDKLYTYRDSNEPVKMWVGTPLLNFTKLQLGYGIYNDSAVASPIHNMFELYRPGKRIIYVPKEMTVKEMLSELYSENANLANTVQVHYQQNVMSHDAKIVDIEASVRDQNQFQIVDLTLSSSVDSDIQNTMLSPHQVYQNILVHYSSRLQKPLAKYLMNNGGPLEFIKTVSLENMNETTFNLMVIYKNIVKIIGPSVDMLSAIMKEDLVILLWHALFSGCTSEFTLKRLLFLLILRNLPHYNLITSDMKQLYHFLSEVLHNLLSNEEISNLYPTLNFEAKCVLDRLMEADLIQNPKYLNRLIEAVVEGDEVLLRTCFITYDDFRKNANFCLRISEMFTKGMNLITTCCKDKKFNNNYLCVSQATLNFMKMREFLVFLEQDGSFENDLLSLITIFEDVSDSNGSIGEANSKMEYKLLEIMDCIFGKMAEIIQHKRDLSNEKDLVSISDSCCAVFNFVQNELEILEKGQDRFSSFDMMLEILKNVNIIMKKLVDSSALCTLGVDAAHQFYYQYLSGMEAMGVSWTIARILGLMKLIVDENLFIGMVISIFELLDLWSTHPVLSKLLEHEVGDEVADGVSLFQRSLEFAKEAESDLRGENADGGPESPFLKKNKELRMTALKLLEKVKKTYVEKQAPNSY